MPDRIIRDWILRSDKVNRLSVHAEVFFRRLLSVVDDHGSADARPEILKGSLFALKHWVRQTDLVRWLNELQRAGLVRFGETKQYPVVIIEDFRAFVTLTKCAAKTKHPLKEISMVQLPLAMPVPLPAARAGPGAKCDCESVCVCEKEKTARPRESQEARGAEEPSLEEVKIYGQFIGLVEWVAEDFWNYWTARDWMASSTVRVTKWQNLLVKEKCYWEAQGRPMSRGNSYGANAKFGKPGVDRNAGTANEGKHEQYKIG